MLSKQGTIATYLSIPFAVVALRNFATDTNQFVPYEFIDEIFHVKQAQAYCQGMFDVWDPKITTPPGLYYLSYLYSQILKDTGIPIELSSSLNGLRLLNFLGGIFIIFFTNVLRRKFNSITAIALYVSPLLTIYYSLFYTDVWSTVFILASYSIGVADFPFDTPVFNVWTSSILGLISVTFRQTNIVWNAFVIAAIIDQRVKQGSGYTGKFLKDIKIFINQVLENWYLVVPFLINFALFGLFLIKNEGITFGDKENHVAVLHIPQLFYCSCFLVALNVPTWFSISIIRDYINDCFGSTKSLLRYVIAMIAIIASVHFFTVVHPFLLADNRHYAFYIWRKVINRDPFFRYYLSPVYHFAIYIIWKMMTLNFEYVLSEEEAEEAEYEAVRKRSKALQEKSENKEEDDGDKEDEEVEAAVEVQKTTLSSTIMIAAYFFCVFATIVPTPLFEPRYYILPYVFWRLLIKVNPDPLLEMNLLASTNNTIRLVCEILFSLAIAQAMYIVFFTIPIIWPTEFYPQRIIW